MTSGRAAWLINGHSGDPAAQLARDSARRGPYLHSGPVHRRRSPPVRELRARQRGGTRKVVRGFFCAQIRLGQARLTLCMRWFGLAHRRPWKPHRGPTVVRPIAAPGRVAQNLIAESVIGHRDPRCCDHHQDRGEGALLGLGRALWGTGPTSSIEPAVDASWSCYATGHGSPCDVRSTTWCARPHPATPQQSGP